MKTVKPKPKTVKTVKPVTDFADPDPDMSLEQLGQYVRDISRRTASDAWRIGRALAYAKHKAKQQEGGWSDWCRVWWPQSKRTTDRYIEVCKEFPTRQRVAGMTQADVFRIIDGRKKEKQKAAPVANNPKPKSKYARPVLDDPTTIEDIRGQDEADTGPKGENDSKLRDLEQRAEKIVRDGAVKEMARDLAVSVDKQSGHKVRVQISPETVVKLILQYIDRYAA